MAHKESIILLKAYHTLRINVTTSNILRESLNYYQSILHIIFHLHNSPPTQSLYFLISNKNEIEDRYKKNNWMSYILSVLMLIKNQFL